MLRIYPVLLELVKTLRPLLRELERRDPDLARQCRSLEQRAAQRGPSAVW